MNRKVHRRAYFARNSALASSQSRASVSPLSAALIRRNASTGRFDWRVHASAAAWRGTRRALIRVDPRMLDDLSLPDDVPIRIAYGDRDLDVPGAKRLAGAITQGTVVFLDDCGHVQWHDQPAAFERWLDEGLRACGLASGAI